MKNNLVPKLVSLFFPLIGLIIYAVNVGKNDKLAKDCLKFSLFGIGVNALLVIAYIWGSEAFFVIMFWVVLFIVLYFIVKIIVK